WPTSDGHRVLSLSGAPAPRRRIGTVSQGRKPRRRGAGAPRCLGCAAASRSWDTLRGQRQAERTAFARLRVDAHLAAVTLDDPLCEIKSVAGTAAALLVEF